MKKNVMFPFYDYGVNIKYSAMTQLMTRLLGFLFFGLTSCQQFEKTNESQPRNNMDSVNTTQSSSAEKKYSLDEIYLRYINQELLSYMEKAHPTWSVPNQNMWYPQLFNKYKTSSSLVNYVRGDFDCNGKTDHALIVDKGRNDLAVVAFLGTDSNFKTVELTDITPIGGVKIDFHLTAYKPGRYAITDPDLEPSDNKYVILKCSSVGIGSFKELYEGGDDVFYWEQGHLRSCVIEK